MESQRAFISNAIGVPYSVKSKLPFYAAEILSEEAEVIYFKIINN
jgi:hypothetical protein